MTKRYRHDWIYEADAAQMLGLRHPVLDEGAEMLALAKVHQIRFQRDAVKNKWRYDRSDIAALVEMRRKVKTMARPGFVLTPPVTGGLFGEEIKKAQ